MHYFILELKRNMFSKFTLIVMFVMIFFLLMHIPYNQQKAENYIKDKRMESYRTAQTASTYLETANSEGNDEDIAFYNDEYETYMLLARIYDSKDYKGSLEVKRDSEYHLIQNELAFLKKNKMLLFSKSEDILRQNKKWFDQLSKDKLIPYATPYENNALNFFYLIIHDNFSLMVLLLLSLSIIPIVVCTDFEVNVYKYTYTYKKSRTSILLSKLGVSFVIAFFTLLLSTVIVFAITLLSFGTGTFNYPYILDNGLILSVKDYLLKAIFIIIPLLSFLISLVFFISYICKKQINAYTYFSLLIAATFVFLNYQISFSFLKYIPLFYLYIEPVISGSMGISIMFADMLCIIGCLCLLCITFIHNRNEDLVME